MDFPGAGSQPGTGPTNQARRPGNPPGSLSERAWAGIVIAGVTVVSLLA